MSSGEQASRTQLSDSRGRFVARSDDPIEVRHGRMAGLELAEGKLGAAAIRMMSVLNSRAMLHGVVTTVSWCPRPKTARLTQMGSSRVSRMAGHLRLVDTRRRSSERVRRTPRRVEGRAGKRRSGVRVTHSATTPRFDSIVLDAFLQ